MSERFRLEYNEAASNEAAFILDTKSGLRARILRFSSFTDLDAYSCDRLTLTVRRVPVLLEAQPSELPQSKELGVLKRMVDWYYYTQLKPPPTTDPPAFESAD